jgi:hypothetical protein
LTAGSERRVHSIGVVSRLGRETDGICTLLEYYRAYRGNSLLTFRYNLSVPSSKATKAKKIQEEFQNHLDFLTPEVKTDVLSQSFGK